MTEPTAFTPGQRVVTNAIVDCFTLYGSGRTLRRGRPLTVVAAAPFGSYVCRLHDGTAVTLHRNAIDAR